MTPWPFLVGAGALRRQGFRGPSRGPCRPGGGCGSSWRTPSAVRTAALDEHGLATACANVGAGLHGVLLQRSGPPHSMNREPVPPPARTCVRVFMVFSCAVWGCALVGLAWVGCRFRANAVTTIPGLQRSGMPPFLPLICPRTCLATCPTGQGTLAGLRGRTFGRSTSHLSCTRSSRRPHRTRIRPRPRAMRPAP